MTVFRRITIAGQARQRLARLNADGSIDTSFAVPAISDGVRFAFLQPDGRIIIAGFFSQVGGVPRDRIARLNADGSLDPSYNPSVGNSTSVMIFSMAMQADGKLVAGGNFDTFGGVARDNIARLNSDGTLDESFAPVVNNQIAAVATQADGKLFICGLFTSIDNVARNYAARLHTDGSVDSTYVPSQWPSSTDGLAIQPDGKMLAAGYNFILRMNADDGLRDQSFPNLTTNNQVGNVVVQADGKIVVSGSFTEIAGTPRNRIARLMADGSLDASYDPGANSSVATLTLQSDGKLLIGGAFTTIGGVPRERLARLNIDGSVDATLETAANQYVSAIAQQADGKLHRAG